MAEYGSIEFYQEEMKRHLLEKTVCEHALKNIVRESVDNEEVFDLVVERLHSANRDIEWCKEKLAEIYKQKLEKGKSEE